VKKTEKFRRKKKKQMNNVEDDVDDKEETRTNHLISNMTKSNMIQTSIPKKQPEKRLLNLRAIPAKKKSSLYMLINRELSK
jgi:hypothetical protein